MRCFAVVSLFAAILFSAAIAVASDTAMSAAPADENFGHYHLSVLGMRNTLHDLDSRLIADPGKSDSLANIVALTEDAIGDWQAKYPRDSWIPRSLLELLHVYHHMTNTIGRAGERRVLDWLDRKYPGNAADEAAHALLKPANCAQDPLLAMSDPQSGDTEIACADTGAMPEPSPSPSP